MPEQKPRMSLRDPALEKHAGPVIAATRLHEALRRPDPRIHPAPLSVLGTDGFGRSDTRTGLRHFFEVDRRYVTVAALKSLADEGQLDAKKVRRSHEEIWHQSQ